MTEQIKCPDCGALLTCPNGCYPKLHSCKPKEQMADVACDRNDCRYYDRQIEFAEKCNECLENCNREHPEGFNYFEVA